MAGPDDITLVENAIHNPNEPRHFMRIVPAGRQIVATAAGTVVADSTDAVIVKEVGRDIYDAVVYFPRSDVNMDALTVKDKSTHCPLKGDTAYFDITAGDTTIDDGAWSYVDTIEGDHLKDLVAFDTSKIDVSL